jgi:hypothetical protein
MDSKNKQSNIDALREDVLRGKGGQANPVERGTLRPHEKKVGEDWGDRSLEEDFSDVKVVGGNKGSFGWKIFFWGAFLFALAASVYAYYAFFIASNEISVDKIDVSIETLDYVDGGESFPVSVVIENTNPAPLNDVSIRLSYPKISQVGEKEEMENIMRTIGSIDSGSFAKENFEIQLYGQLDDTKQIEAYISSNITGSTTPISKQTTKVITLKSTPITLAIENDKEVVNNQKTEFIFRASSTSTEEVKDLLLDVVYPANFEFLSADPAPDFGNSIWTLDPISNTESIEVKVEGIIHKGTSQKQSVEAYIGKRDPNAKHKIIATYFSTTETMDIAKPFVVAEMLYDKSDDNVAYYFDYDTIEASIVYENTTDDVIRNLEFEVAFDGNAFGDQSIISSGYYDSISKKLIFNSSTNNELTNVEPGDVGTIKYKIKPLSVLTKTGSVIINPNINTQLSVRGLSASGGNNEALQIDEKEIKLHSVVSVVPSTLYYSGLIKNSGPMPPKATETTEYTLYFDLRSSSNRIENGKLTFKLPVYVEWLGVVQPRGLDVEYNPVEKEITWNIDEIPVGAGYTAPAKVMHVQVAVTPSTTHIGDDLAITKEINFKGTDKYTERKIRIEKQPLSTILINDGDGQGRDGKVVR